MHHAPWVSWYVFVLQGEGQPADKISHATKGGRDKRENCVGQAEEGGIRDTESLHRMQGQFVPNRCVPDRKFLDVAPLGQSGHWTLCP